MLFSHVHSGVLIYGMPDDLPLLFVSGDDAASGGYFGVVLLREKPIVSLKSGDLLLIAVVLIA